MDGSCTSRQEVICAAASVGGVGKHTMRKSQHTQKRGQNSAIELLFTLITHVRISTYDAWTSKTYRIAKLGEVSGKWVVPPGWGSALVHVF